MSICTKKSGRIHSYFISYVYYIRTARGLGESQIFMRGIRYSDLYMEKVNPTDKKNERPNKPE